MSKITQHNNYFGISRQNYEILQFTAVIYNNKLLFNPKNFCLPKFAKNFLIDIA